MIVALRFIGVMNAAVWFGGAFFYSFGVAPGFMSDEMRRIFGDYYSGVISLMLAERYWTLYIWCGVIALVHQLAEWVYLGKSLQRLVISILATVFCLGLIGGLWLQPKLFRLHQIRYTQSELYTPSMKAQATRSFSLWRGVSRTTNFLALTGLLIYAWRVTTPPSGPRFVTTNKFRS